MELVLDSFNLLFTCNCTCTLLPYAAYVAFIFAKVMCTFIVLICTRKSNDHSLDTYKTLA